MANLKADLDEYLSRNDTKPLLPNLPGSVSLPKLGSWFRKSDVPEESEGWLGSAQKDCCPSMSKFQRITGFCFCMCMGLLCFGLSALYIPVLLLKARKFALLYTMGSLFFISSFSFLWGPVNLLKHMFSKERLCFTVCYLTTLIVTLYCALVLVSTPLTVLAAVGQVISLLWFLLTYIPGGQTGLKFFSRIFSTAVTSSVSKTLPV